MFQPRNQALVPIQDEPMFLPSLQDKPCPYCAEPIKAAAIKCRHCGEMLGAATGSLAQPAQPAQVVINNVVHNSLQGGYQKPLRSRTMAAVLALFLGGLGVHKFYVGRSFMGLLYLMFSPTLIPMAVGVLEAISYISYGSDEEFTHRVCA